MRLFFTSCMLLLFTAVGITAQEDTEAFNRLPELLEQVPDTDASRQFFSFADYEAMTLARPDAERPPNNDAFETGEPQYEQWWASVLGTYSGVRLDFLPIWFDEADAYMGFTFFDTNASVQYGTPPEFVQLLIANYDSDAVITTHEDRDYTITEEDNYILLCSENGCDAGSQINIDERLRGYMFGGDLGREFPVLMIEDEGIILGSPGFPAVEAHIELLEDGEASLADDPDYASIAEVSSIGVETVIQGHILPVGDIVTTAEIITLMLGEQATQEQRDAFAEQFGLDDAENNLPAYDVFAIIDGATGDEQVVRLILIYDNEADAEQASGELALRIPEINSLVSFVTIEELFDERDATYDIRVVSIENQERYATVIEWRAPLATTLRDEGTGTLNASSQVYQLLYQLVISEDTAWLAPNLDED